MLERNDSIKLYILCVRYSDGRLIGGLIIIGKTREGYSVYWYSRLLERLWDQKEVDGGQVQLASDEAVAWWTECTVARRGYPVESRRHRRVVLSNRTMRLLTALRLLQLVVMVAASPARNDGERKVTSHLALSDWLLRRRSRPHFFFIQNYVNKQKKNKKTFDRNAMRGLTTPHDLTLLTLRLCIASHGVASLTNERQRPWLFRIALYYSFYRVLVLLRSRNEYGTREKRYRQLYVYDQFDTIRFDP